MGTLGGAIGLVIYAVCTIAYVLLDAYQSVSVLGQLLNRVNYLVVIVLMGHTNLFMTAWVLKQARDNQHYVIDERRNSDEHTKRFRRCCWTSFKSTPLSHMEFLLDTAVNMENFKRCTMLDVLSSPEGFDLFLLHILKEFSTENML